MASRTAWTARCSCAIAAFAWSEAARALPPIVASGLSDDEAATVFDPPAPPTLPGLTRRDLTFTFEYTAAAIATRNTQAASSTAFAWFSHGEIELPVVQRKWFVGIAHDTAAASVPGVGRSFLVGGPELWGRGVWSSVRGLSSGGGLGVVIPVGRDVSREQAELLRTSRVVRPWDETHFRDATLTFRPWFDMRHITGPFIFQLRQGLDWSLYLRELDKPLRTDLTARATFYFGYRAAKVVGLGLELWEVYQLTEGLPDDKRAAFAISPSIRFLLARVQPALSVLLPIATPLRGDVDSYYAARLNVGFTFPTGEPARASASR